MKYISAWLNAEVSLHVEIQILITSCYQYFRPGGPCPATSTFGGNMYIFFEVESIRYKERVG